MKKAFGLRGKAIFWAISFACIWLYLPIIDWFSIGTLLVFTTIPIVLCNVFAYWFLKSMLKSRWTGMIIAAILFSLLQVEAFNLFGKLFSPEAENIAFPVFAFMAFYFSLVCANFLYTLIAVICRSVMVYRQRQEEKSVNEKQALFVPQLD